MAWLLLWLFRANKQDRESKNNMSKILSELNALALKINEFESEAVHYYHRLGSLIIKIDQVEPNTPLNQDSRCIRALASLFSFREKEDNYFGYTNIQENEEDLLLLIEIAKNLITLIDSDKAKAKLYEMLLFYSEKETFLWASKAVESMNSIIAEFSSEKKWNDQFIYWISRALDISLKMNNIDWINKTLDAIEIAYKTFISRKEVGFRYILDISSIYFDFFSTSKNFKRIERTLFLEELLDYLAIPIEFYSLKKSYFEAQNFMESKEKIACILKKNDIAIDMLIARVNSLANNGRDRGKEPFAKVVFLDDAIKLLVFGQSRYGNNQKFIELLEELGKEIIETGEMLKESRKDSFEFEHKLEIPSKVFDEPIERILSYEDINHSIFELIRTTYVIDVEKFTQEQRKSLDEFIFWQITSTRIIDDGRIIDKLKPKDYPQFESNRLMVTNFSLWSEMVISRALKQLIEKERISIHSFTGMFKGLVASSRLNLLKSGLEAWYSNDYYKSIHILIPSFEDMLKTILRNCGVFTSKVDGNGYQVLTLGALLNKGKTMGIIDDNQYHFLTLILTSENGGLNLRNRVCHGLSSENDFTNMNASNVIHCILILAKIAIINQQKS